ncbi:FeoA family protein [Polynucleobacter necessarius]|uniref:FeoA family protein n=1 Tax=Polynucleobacter necessarius TaxID=576610 RepID=UPI001E34D9BE|nr:FeoA family protein [Polynucleobacter necessarius]
MAQKHNRSLYSMHLDQVDLGSLYRVSEVNAPKGAPQIKGQLEDIGFLPGEQVTLLRKGLLKRGPYLVRVGASTFALRESEARMIAVERIAHV